MGTKVLRHSRDGLQWILSQSQLQNEFKIETLVSRWCYGYFQQSNRCHFRFWNRFHSNQFDPKSGLGRKDFSEVPKEIQFWLGSRETKSSTGTKWSPENILVYNSTYYDMLEFNSMMKLMQSVSLMLLMLLLWHKFNQNLPFLKIGLLPSSNYRGFPSNFFIEISFSLILNTHQLACVLYDESGYGERVETFFSLQRNRKYPISSKFKFKINFQFPISASRSYVLF